MKYKTAFYSFYLPVAAAMYIVSVFVLYTQDVKELIGMMGMTLKGCSKLRFTELVKMLE